MLLNGADDVVEVMDYLRVLSSGVISNSSEMTVIAVNISSYLSSAHVDGCSRALHDISTMNSIQAGTDDVALLLEDIPDAMMDAKDVFTLYAKDRKNEVLNMAYYVSWLVILLYIIGGVFRSKTYYRFLIAIAGLLVLVLTVICCVEMSLVVS